MPHYRGITIPIPIGQGGLVGTQEQANAAPDSLIIADGLSYEGRLLRKEGGAAKYNSTAITGSPSIIGGHDWWPTAGTQRMVVLGSNGTLYKDTGSADFAVTLASGLTVSDIVPVFVEGGKEAAANNRKLFLFTGKNAVQVLSADGATTSNIATPPADWSGVNQPSFGMIHEGRLWGGGNANDPHRLYYSTTGNHEDLTGSGAGSLSIYPGEGERLVGGLSFNGAIILWKYPLGVYFVDTSDPTSANWKARRLSSAIGGASPHGFTQIDRDVMFIDPTGNIHLLSAVQEFGDAAASSLSQRFDIYSFIQNNINLARLPYARAVYYGAKREVHFALAATGSTTNNFRFVVDLNHENMLRFRYSTRDVCESLWLRKDTVTLVQRLISGDTAGFVWLMDQVLKAKDGAGYVSTFQTPYLDFAYADPLFATNRKIGQFLEVVVEPTGSHDLFVDVLWDGRHVQTINFNLGVIGAALGSFVLGTDTLATNRIVNRKRRLLGSGRRLSLVGRNSTALEDFAIGQFFFHGLVGDERMGRDDDT